MNLSSHKSETPSGSGGIHHLTADDFQSALHTPLSERLRTKINQMDLRYEELTPAERDRCILQIVRELQNPDLIKVGPHRLPHWEKGWTENLNAIRTAKALEAIVPKYFGKCDYIRWKQNFVRPRTEGYDYRVLDILVEWMLEICMTSVDYIHEFGCGTGCHLTRAGALNSGAKLVGLDWAKSSQAILATLAESGLVKNLEGRNFDFFHPDYDVELPPNSGIYTVAALEQVASDFEPFLQFLLAKKPRICAHLEPIDELLDPHSLVDGLSIFYFRKRRYLQGFLPRLRQLAAEGKLVIHHQRRTYTGSQFIEGHSLVIWSPL